MSILALRAIWYLSDLLNPAIVVWKQPETTYKWRNPAVFHKTLFKEKSSRLDLTCVWSLLWVIMVLRLARFKGRNGTCIEEGADYLRDETAQHEAQSPTGQLGKGREVGGACHDQEGKVCMLKKTALGRKDSYLSGILSSLAPTEGKGITQSQPVWRQLPPGKQRMWPSLACHTQKSHRKWVHLPTEFCWQQWHPFSSKAIKTKTKTHVFHVWIYVNIANIGTNPIEGEDSGKEQKMREGEVGEDDLPWSLRAGTGACGEVSSEGVHGR